MDTVQHCRDETNLLGVLGVLGALAVNVLSALTAKTRRAPRIRQAEFFPGEQDFTA